jgi:hypothetical protein
MVKLSRTTFGFLGLPALLVFGLMTFCLVCFGCFFCFGCFVSFTGLVFSVALDAAGFGFLAWTDLRATFLAAVFFLAAGDFFAALGLAGDFLAALDLVAGDFFVAGLSATWGSSAAAVGVAVLIISHLLQGSQPSDLGGKTM